MMLAEIGSGFYQYIRGAILILSLYNFFIYTQNRNKQFLYYSAYFVFIFIFFAGQEFYDNSKIRLFHIITPSLHCGLFIFYLSFARVVLKTKHFIPKWDALMVGARKITAITAILFLVVYVIFGHGIQSKMFIILGFSAFVFTLFSYYHFFKIKNKITQLFLLGSFLYSFMAMLSFFAGFSFGGYEDFINRFNAHPTIFMYVGSLFEALVFSILIGNKIASLEKEKVETLKRLTHLKKIVVKNHIILKDKTKIYISELIYVKVEDHYLSLYLSNDKNHFVRGKLKNIKSELPPNFVQCHRSYLVNSNYIKQMSKDSLVLINKKEIPISRTYKSYFEKNQLSE